MSESDFAVKDKRHFDAGGDIKETDKEETSSSGRKEAEEAVKEPGSPETRESPTCDGPPPLPAVNFSTFIFSLSTSALMNLGELPDPNTRQSCRNIPLAKQTIDILAMLKEKTNGNLEREEEQLLSNLLYELRIKYVTAVKK